MKNFYKNIVFDLDGTLINSNLASLKSLQKTIKIVENRELTITELEIVLGLPDYDAFEILGLKNKSQCDYVWRIFSAELESEKNIFPEIIDILSFLKELGINLGIVTSRNKEQYLSNIHIRNTLGSFFNTVITSELTKEHKPRPAPLLKWLELTNSDPSKTLYIGDTKYDYICATKSRVDFGLAAWGIHQSMDVNLVFSNPSQILLLFN